MKGLTQEELRILEDFIANHTAEWLRFCQSHGLGSIEAFELANKFTKEVYG